MNQEPPNVTSVEECIVYAFVGIIDLIKFVLGFIPIIDLIGSGLWFLGFGIMFFYYLIRLGPGVFLGGKKSTKKIGVFFLTTMVGAIPALDDFIPELTIQAISTFGNLREERKAYFAKKSALNKIRNIRGTNDNVQQQELSRAA